MDAVRQQLVVYERQGRIIKWHDRQIPPGTEWESAIDYRINHSHIILLFVSPDFIESRYCWDVEVRIALERHEAKTARVIPIIVRPCALEATPFAKLQALPENAKPLTQFADRDQVTLDVARAIMKVADEIENTPPAPERSTAAARNNGIYTTKLEGDRIPRLLASFSPPTGANIPAGYRQRLNQLAVEVRRDSAIRRHDGKYRFPAQFSGPTAAVASVVERLSKDAELVNLGRAGENSVDVWFEYVGTLPPNNVRQIAESAGLKVVHCGVALVYSP